MASGSRNVVLFLQKMAQHKKATGKDKREIDHEHHSQENPEPERIEAELEDGGIKDGGGQNQECQILDE